MSLSHTHLRNDNSDSRWTSAQALNEASMIRELPRDQFRSRKSTRSLNDCSAARPPTLRSTSSSGMSTTRYGYSSLRMSIVEPDSRSALKSLCVSRGRPAKDAEVLLWRLSSKEILLNARVFALPRSATIRAKTLAGRSRHFVVSNGHRERNERGRSSSDSRLLELGHHTLGRSKVFGIIQIPPEATTGIRRVTGASQRARSVASGIESAAQLQRCCGGGGGSGEAA